MPVAKLRGSSTPDVMKSEEGNDSLDTYVRQAVGKEPFLSFSRTGDSPVQWIQLLHALDQQADLPGWPLLSPLKIQMQKCDKCSREFCSPINYRRHIRVHRRSLNVDKESHKSRDLLGAFWDKLSLDKAKEVMSFKDVTLEEVPGSSIIKSLTSLIRKPGFCTLPQLYLKAGSALLDIIQSRPSRLPVSSHELFSILDDASERTFLCAGTAESMQKYVFDGEAGKIGQEMKNLIACTSFLVEQKLVKAWVADKDAEALRCQKLLVEEEEAAQKRQAQLLERKRLRKLRQKEQKVKEQANGEKVHVEDITADVLDSLPSAEISSPSVESESSSNALETTAELVPSPFEPVQTWSAEEDEDIEGQYEFNREHSDSGTVPNAERRTVHGDGRRSRWQMPKSQRFGRNGFYPTQNPQVLKLEHKQNHASPGDPRVAPIVSGNKVWTRKTKLENEGKSLKSILLTEDVAMDQHNNSEVMIGSISVTLGNCTAPQQGDDLIEAQEYAISKPTKTDSIQGGSESTVKLWRQVSRQEARGPMPVQNGCAESKDEIIGGGKCNDRMVPSETCLRSCVSGENGAGSQPPVDGSAHSEGSLFSSNAAKAFLAQRWKEAIAADHVKLVLSAESDPPGCPDTGNDGEVVKTLSDHRRTILGNADNVLANGRLVSTATDAVKAKVRIKPEKGVTTKYIPKQRAVT